MMQFFRVLGVVLALGFAVQAVVPRRLLHDAAVKPSNGDQPEFDYFFFVRQWPGGYCSEHSCPSLHTHGFQFTIHGLWPNYNNGRWPQFCDPGLPFRAADIDDLEYVMDEEWPSFSGDNDVFWSHEWNKHGTCALHVLPSEHTYFKEALKLHYKLDLAAAFHAGGISPSSSQRYAKRDVMDAIHQLYGVDAQLHCAPDGTLMEVWMCVDRQMKPFSCKEDVHAADYCAHVRLPPPPGSHSDATWRSPLDPGLGDGEQEGSAEGDSGRGDYQSEGYDVVDGQGAELSDVTYDMYYDDNDSSARDEVGDYYEEEDYEEEDYEEEDERESEEQEEETSDDDDDEEEAEEEEVKAEQEQEAVNMGAKDEVKKEKAEEGKAHDAGDDKDDHDDDKDDHEDDKDDDEDDKDDDEDDKDDDKDDKDDDEDADDDDDDDDNDDDDDDEDEDEDDEDEDDDDDDHDEDDEDDDDDDKWRGANGLFGASHVEGTVSSPVEMIRSLNGVAVIVVCVAVAVAAMMVAGIVAVGLRRASQGAQRGVAPGTPVGASREPEAQPLLAGPEKVAGHDVVQCPV